MTIDVFAMVLGAALLHAAWNALVKVNADRLIMVAIMMISQAAVAFLALPFVAFPTPASWSYIWASAALHSAYYVFLIMAYRYGDLSHVYPIARGSSPLIVALISVILVGEVLGHKATLAIVLIAVGIMSLALTRGTSGLREPKASLLCPGNRSPDSRIYGCRWTWCPSRPQRPQLRNVAQPFQRNSNYPAGALPET